MNRFHLSIFVILLIFTASAVSQAQEFRKRDFKNVILPALEQGDSVEMDLAKYCVQYPKNELAKQKLEEVSSAFLLDWHHNYMQGLLISYELSGYNKNIILSYWKDSKNFKILEQFCALHSQVVSPGPAVDVKIFQLLPFTEFYPDEINIGYCSSFIEKVQTSQIELSLFTEELKSSIQSDLLSNDWMENSHESIQEAIELLRKNEEPAISQMIFHHKELQARQFIYNGRIKENFTLPRKSEFRDSIISQIFSQTSVFKENSNWTSDLDSLVSECVENTCGPEDLKILNDFSSYLTVLSECEFSDSRESTLKFILGADFREWSISVNNQIESQLDELYNSAVNEVRTSIDDLIVLYEEQEKIDFWLDGLASNGQGVSLEFTYRRWTNIDVQGESAFDSLLVQSIFTLYPDSLLIQHEADEYIRHWQTTEWVFDYIDGTDIYYFNGYDPEENVQYLFQIHLQNCPWRLCRTFMYTIKEKDNVIIWDNPSVESNVRRELKNVLESISIKALDVTFFECANGAIFSFIGEEPLDVRIEYTQNDSIQEYIVLNVEDLESKIDMHSVYTCEGPDGEQIDITIYISDNFKVHQVKFGESIHIITRFNLKDKIYTFKQ